MKKQLVVALGLSVLATPAFATKARLEALGENVQGSFIVQDNRNIFYNAAHVNNHRDLVTFEWGDTAEAIDTAATPRAEAGIFRTLGNLVWGVHFGNASNAGNGFRAASGVALTEQNVLDLFVGGDAGIKWGANATYSKTANAGTTGDDSQEALRTRLGVIAGDIEGWANINIRNKASVGGREFDGDLGYNVGAIYNFQGYRLFADYQSLDAEGSGAPLGNTDIKSSQIQVGAGRIARLNDRATLFTRVQYTRRTAENAAAGLAGTGTFGATPSTCSWDSAIGCTDFTGARIPVVVGMEYDATSWLVLRGSVTQVLWGTEDDNTNKRNPMDTTAVAAGASLRFGEFAIDGSVNNIGFGRLSAIYNF